MQVTRTWCVGALVVLSGCGSEKAPTTPTPPGSANLTAPAVVTPVADAQLSTLRPTFTVTNGTSDQQGAKTYEFQISDRTDFSSAAVASIPGLFVVVTQTGVAEGANGQTSFTPSVDLQPTTRMYWRARMTQGTATSAWSATAVFRTRLVGFNRSGELYDPLIHGETIGVAIGSTTYIPGVGIRINDQRSFVVYDLPTTITNGEFSADVEGLAPNGPDHKLKIFSMSDGPDDLYLSDYQVSTMYRGIAGNPPNCIAFKAVFGGGSPIEPDYAQREAAVMSLNPATTYHWKATWGTEFRLSVRAGGLSGNEIYNLGFTSNGRTYAPPRHFAYLGSTNGQSNNEPGSFPGAIYRNVWIGNRPRPASLGSALQSLR